MDKKMPCLRCPSEVIIARGTFADPTPSQGKTFKIFHKDYFFGERIFGRNLVGCKLG
jgi:hypothetical protein